MSAPESRRLIGSRNARVALPLVAIVAGMGMMAYASVPLYQLFCQVTGYGGTTQVAEATDGRVLDREMVIRFNADVNPALPWAFRPEQHEVRVKVGEQGLAFYRTENRSSRPIVGTAVYNVTPQKAGLYSARSSASASPSSAWSRVRASTCPSPSSSIRRSPKTAIWMMSAP